jgi:hypothetical protein
VEPSAAVPSPPATLQLKSAALSVSLTWPRSAEDPGVLSPEPSTNFLGYSVYRRDDTAGTGSPFVLLSVRPQTGTVFHDLGVETGRTYTFMVRSLSTSGVESSGVTASATPQDGTPPASPINVKATSGPDVGKITISWAPNSEGDLVGYRL